MNSIDDIKKFIVLTGGNKGIGYETVKDLYEEGHHVIFGSRNQNLNQQALKKLRKKQGSGTLQGYSLDLSKKQSIQGFVLNIQNKFEKVDILINNAAVILQEKQISQLGVEMTYTVNHFGHFYLTYLLFQNLKKSREGRIVNVSSMAHYRSKDNFLNDLQAKQQQFNGYTQYCNSKLCNILFTVELNELIKKSKFQNLKVVALHPGVVDTQITSHLCFFKFLRCCCHSCVFKGVEQGAETTLHLCKIPFQQLRSGEYYDDKKYKEMDSKARNSQSVQKLWEKSQSVYGIKFR